MGKSTKISLICSRTAGFNSRPGDYAGYEKEIKKHVEICMDNILGDSPDLIVLPEHFNWMANGLAYNDKKGCEDKVNFIKYLGESFVDYLKSYAINNNTNIAAGVLRYYLQDDKKPLRNSLVYIGRDGEIKGIYDKNHLVPWEYDCTNVGYGKDADVINLDIGRVASAICFDLNFDELLYKYKEQNPDLIVFSSAYHGAISQEIWAYNCRSYFAGATACGNGRILNPFGEVVARTTNYTNYVTGTVNLDYQLCHLDENRPKFMAAKKKYKTDLTIYDPGYVGSVMLTCENPDMNVQDIIDEFEIERLDTYLDRSRAHKNVNI